MAITFNGGQPAPINPNGFIKNQNSPTQTPGDINISGGAEFGTAPNLGTITGTGLAFIDFVNLIVGGISGRFIDFQDLSANRLSRFAAAANNTTGINRWQGRPYNFDVKVGASLAPVDPTDLVRLQDLPGFVIPGVPTIVIGAGLGGAPASVQIFGNNFMGQVVLQTGAAGTLPNSVLATITFGSGATYGTTATPVIGPTASGGDLNGIALVFANPQSNNAWAISCGPVALAINSVYRFNYMCGGVV